MVELKLKNQCSVINLVNHSQSYHGGIEICNRKVFSIIHWSPNRTMVELKFNCYYKVTTRLNSPNRTMVELKYFQLSLFFVVVVLPIVPWWNWNDGTKLYSMGGFSAPNRTMVELKSANYDNVSLKSQGLPIVPWWNWNKIFVVKGLVGRMAPNRTMVELKFGLSSSNNCWASSQSYHGGIEIFPILV